MVSVPGQAASGEIHLGPGFRIETNVTRPDPALVARLGAFETPDVSDLMNRLYTMDVGIRPIVSGARVLGPACTVKVFPGDNLMVHKALDVAAPGDVIVVDTGRSGTNAVLGDMITTKASHREVGGFVIDGLVRDVDGIRALGTVPVFARGVTPIGPLHRGPGEINHPVSCGGIVVHPGDVVVGDANGVAVVPRRELPGIVERLEERAEAQRAYADAVARGEFSMAWVDRTLTEAGLRLPRPGSPPGPEHP